MAIKKQPPIPVYPAIKFVLQRQGGTVLLTADISDLNPNGAFGFANNKSCFYVQGRHPV